MNSSDWACLTTYHSSPTERCDIVPALDSAVPPRAQLLLNPQTFERELTRPQENDPTIADFEPVACQLANLDRQKSNLAAGSANLSAIAGESMRRQIAAVSQEHE
jgi:hypothetical protein